MVTCMGKITSPRWGDLMLFQLSKHEEHQLIFCAFWNCLCSTWSYLKHGPGFSRWSGFPCLALDCYCTCRFCREDSFLCIAIFEMTLPFVMTGKLGMSCNLKKRLLESARHRPVWASSRWTPFHCQRSELGGLGHFCCTRCTSLLTALPSIRPCVEQQQQLCSPGVLSPVNCRSGGVLVCIPNLERTGHLCCANIHPLSHTQVEAKQFPAAHQGSQWTYQ